MIGKIRRLLGFKRPAPIDPVTSGLESLAKRKNPFNFLQVGSSDGDLNDSLRPYIDEKRAVGVFVEPIASSIQKLKENYAGYKGLVFEICAVDNQAGNRTLYQISGSSEELPEWAYQVASFDRQVLLNHAHAIPDIRARISELTVECRTLAQIIDSNEIRSIDCLQIDTEGYDYEILRSFPFQEIRPDIVIYEHKHLSADAKESAISLLRRFDYSVVVASTDVIAEAK